MTTPASKTDLKISDTLSLPLDTVTSSVAVLAVRGAGKTYCASVLAEEMLKQGQPVVVIDPVGAWWGIRDGFPVAILGGEHGDIQLDASSGAAVAEAVVEGRFPCVIDLSLFRRPDMLKFVLAFAETLYHQNREPLHLIVDEADLFAPQVPGKGQSEVLTAFEDLVRRGRRKGLGITMITQRASVINKNVLTQCETLIVLRQSHPKDVEAVGAWVDTHATGAECKAMTESLPSLKTGQAWVWSPSRGDVFAKVNIRKRDTFDSSATPSVGQTAAKPKKMTEVNLAGLGAKIRAVVDRTLASDPKAMQARLRDLEEQVRLGNRPGEPVVRVVPVVDAAQAQAAMDQMTALRDQTFANIERLYGIPAAVLGELTDAGNHDAARLNDRPTARPTPEDRMPLVVEASDYAGSHREPARKAEKPTAGRSGASRMLVALAQKNRLTPKQIALRAGLSGNSGTFKTYLSTLLKNGWVARAGDVLEITDAGRRTLGDYKPLPTGRELLAWWANSLGGGSARMLNALAFARGRTVTREELGQTAGLSSESGTFKTYLSRLKTLDLVEQDAAGRLALSAEMF